jgi:CTD kinase subunit alpha
MVFEYMDHDLTGILSQPQYIFDASHLKSFSHQILSGLAYLHDRAVLHRDMKGSNILVNAQGELKLADFGLARFYNKRRVADYTNRVITLWYRPPELLLGATEYGPEVDTWSAGCVAAASGLRLPPFENLHLAPLSLLQGASSSSCSPKRSPSLARTRSPSSSASTTSAARRSSVTGPA